MSFKDYKRGLSPVEDQAIQNSRQSLVGFKYPFSWKNRGSWRDRARQKHPGWAAYHANKDQK